jgi:hypothetical protein
VSGLLRLASGSTIAPTASNLRRSWVTIEVNNQAMRVLVIETPLRLWIMAEEYNDARVEALIAAAKAFKANPQNRIDSFRLISIAQV